MRPGFGFPPESLSLLDPASGAAILMAGAAAHFLLPLARRLLARPS